jgi:K+-transporting ATPase ATPase C chain
MKRDAVTSAIAMVVFTVLLGILYPLAITGIGQAAFPGEANGQQIRVDGRLVGSKLIGQSFRVLQVKSPGGSKAEAEQGEAVTEPDKRYFQSRPSATEGGAYDAAASAFSNRGPNGKNTEQADAESLKSYLALEQPYDPSLSAAQVPVDAVNTSGSDLDPEISQANAWIQAHRIAAVRHLALGRVDALIAAHTAGRGLGFSGEPGVNVLELNLALDREARRGGR